MALTPKKIDVRLKLPFLEIGGEWEPDDAERRASWEMYVELVSRISVAELGPDEGSLREALSSLYSLFGSTREILRHYGPDVAQSDRDGTLSFGYIAIAVLNGALRPLLSVWHPRLAAYEATRPADRSTLDHERAWDAAPALREALNLHRGVLVEYARILGEAAGAPALLRAVEDTAPNGG